MERAPDFITDLKLQFRTSPELDAFLDDTRRAYPPGADGVPVIPRLSAEQTRQWLNRCGRVDALMQDADARGADVTARGIARGISHSVSPEQPSAFATDLKALQALPKRLAELVVAEQLDPKGKREAEKSAAQKANKFIADTGTVDKRCDTYERSMAGPTDSQRFRAGAEAMAAFNETQAARDPRITFGMSQLMSAQEQHAFCTLDDRFKAVERVNRFLDYGAATGERAAERSDLSSNQANTLATTPAGLDAFYSSSRFGTIGDGFDQKAQVRHELSVVDRALTNIQQRDGIANDGSFTLPMLTKEQSTEWLERCERMNAVVSRAAQQPAPAGKPAAAPSIDQVRANMTDVAAMPRKLASIAKSGESPERQREDVERLLLQSRQIDVHTQAFEQSFTAAPKTKTFGERLSGAWDRMRETVRGLNPFRSAAPATISLQPAAGEPPMRSLDSAPLKAAQSAGLVSRSAAHGEERIVVSSGEVGHETARGAGFAALGTVETVKHVGDAVEIDYTIRDHHFDVKIDGKDAAGRALAHAADELKPGDAFKISIGRDHDGKDVAHVDDRTTGHSVTVDRTGHVDENDHAADLSRSRQNSIGR